MAASFKCDVCGNFVAGSPLKIGYKHREAFVDVCVECRDAARGYTNIEQTRAHASGDPSRILNDLVEIVKNAIQHKKGK